MEQNGSYYRRRSDELIDQRFAAFERTVAKLERNMEERFARAETNMQARFEHLDAKITVIEERFDGLDRRLLAIVVVATTIAALAGGGVADALMRMPK